MFLPSAKVADGRLILSLPDAETPVVWVMDLPETGATVLRLETDKQGFYVLRRHGSKAAAETVAVYRDRKAASRALMKATRALEKAREVRSISGPNGRPIIIRPASKWSRVITVFLGIWFVCYLSGFDRPILRFLLSPFYGQQTVSAQQLQPQQPLDQQQPAAPQSGKPPEAGTPMSADDFLRNQHNNGDLPAGM